MQILQGHKGNRTVGLAKRSYGKRWMTGAGCFAPVPDPSWVLYLYRQDRREEIMGLSAREVRKTLLQNGATKISKHPKQRKYRF